MENRLGHWRPRLYPQNERTSGSVDIYSCAHLINTFAMLLGALYGAKRLIWFISSIRMDVEYTMSSSMARAEDDAVAMGAGQAIIAGLYDKKD